LSIVPEDDAIMWYELWGVTSGNLITDFDTEADAVEAARAYITQDESGPAVDVSLIVYDDQDRPIQSLEDDALAGWADLATNHT
jgi:hypothetical protein